MAHNESFNPQITQEQENDELAAKRRKRHKMV
jgi:hypothetical protein